MRITSWNCQGRECRKRAAHLDHLRADVIVLQECTKPTAVDNQCIWFENPGANGRGVGIVTTAQWRVEAGPKDATVPDSVFPARISGAVSINLLAVWALPTPTYIRAIVKGLDRYREFLRAAGAMVVGDFNSPKNDPHSHAEHMILEDRLRNEFGLVSAWRLYAERSGAQTDTPTFYLGRKEKQPFHIDYCFLPEDWSRKLQSVEIGNYLDWATQSDHRPITVQFATQ